MIGSGDKRASSAFLEGLRAEPVSSVTPLNGRSILQVSGLEQAIAVADDGLRMRARTKSEPPPDRDIFDSLVGATDDVAAAAIYRAYVPTPLPPPNADETVVIAIPRLDALPSFPAPIVVLDRDLFYRPPPPAAEAAHLASQASLRRFVWAALAFVVPVATLIAIMAIFASTWTEQPRVVQSTMATPLPPIAPTAKPIASMQLVHPADEIMVIEVKQLKSAPPPKPRRR